jgi:uncharacterized protein (TIGR02996 family)
VTRPLIDEILRQPESDEALLVYADWLMSNGNPLFGEEIRIIAELRRMGVYQHDDLYDAHHLDLPSLTRAVAFKKRWRELIRGAIHTREENAILYRLGFVNPRKVEEQLGPFRESPLVRALYLESGLSREELAAIPKGTSHRVALERLTELNVRCVMGEGLLAPILAVTPNIEKLAIGLSSDTQANDLANATLPKLRQLDIRSSKISAEAMSTLANRSTWAGNLTHLNVSSTAIGDDGIRTILGGAFPNLEQLEAMSTKSTGAAFALSPSMTKPLRELDMRFTTIDDDATMEKLVSNSVFQKLRTLQLCCELGSRSLAALAQLPAPLEHLELACTDCTADSFTALLTSTSFRLSRFTLARIDYLPGSAPIEPALVDLIESHAPSLARLGSLTLNSMQLTDRTAQALTHAADAGHFAHLRHLEIVSFDPKARITLSAAHLPELLFAWFGEVLPEVPRAWMERMDRHPLLTFDPP